jgi:hypothetical protein
VLVAIVIGVTVPEPSLVTYAAWPFGVMAMAPGLLPTLMGVPAELVAIVIGVTLFEK